MISVIIPYKNHPKRIRQFVACFKMLMRQAEEAEAEMKLFIHETDGRVLGDVQIMKNKQVELLYTQRDGVFHRAWMMNAAARQMDVEGTLMFMDGDLLLEDGYFNGIEELYHPFVGWSSLRMLSPDATDKVLAGEDVRSDKLNILAVRTPKPQGNAGGITVMPKDLFFSVKGFPEDFEGTWGGEDNALWLKLQSMGYAFAMLDRTVWHMHHEHKTRRRMDILYKWHRMEAWNASKWKSEMDRIDDDWGRLPK